MSLQVEAGPNEYRWREREGGREGRQREKEKWGRERVRASKREKREADK